MISGVLVETLHFDLLNDPNAVCNSVSLIGAVVKQWNSAMRGPSPGQAAILHQSKQRIRELVGCCRRYRATASGGSNGRENSLLEGRALMMIRTTVGALRLGVWSGPSEAHPKTKTTRMVIQTKETRYDHGARWTAVKHCNLPGVRW